jgi:hypothetical protein
MGDLGKRSAWKRRNGLFAPVSLFIGTHNETLSVAARQSIPLGSRRVLRGEGSQQFTGTP